MVRLKPWQWFVLAAPMVAIFTFFIVSAGLQIQAWGISWIWGIVVLMFVGWRWLLVRWTQPEIERLEAAIDRANEELKSLTPSADNETGATAEVALQTILTTARSDRPIWEDWQTFWQRCQEVVVATSQLYHPEVKYPLLNIYVPQAYGLIRGTVDDMDRWMQQVSPALNQVTVGQAFQAYEVYQKLEPSARKLWQVWNWTQWLLNPAVALARQASQKSKNRATQELLVNLGQMLREVALRNLCQQAIALYSNSPPPILSATSETTLPKAKTQTILEILQGAEPVEAIAQKPVNILLVGRTGAGKSSLINTLFSSDLAEVDVLPSTDKIQNYRWETETGETLILWDTPGYEQVNRPQLPEQVLDFATTADLLLLVTPALDPALQMDVDFLRKMKAEVEELPTIAMVSGVDRLRPIREWEPPYDWVWGTLPKEKAIREATEYRTQMLGEFCSRVLPVVMGDRSTDRTPWNADALSLALLETIDPAMQLRLARFLRNLDARTAAAANIIDRYTFQMATAQGLASLLKSPILLFLSQLTTGSPTLAYLLAEKIPVEQLPVVIGKLQMAYDLFSLLSANNAQSRNFDLLALWPLLRENSATPDRNAWAFGHALVEYWTQNLTVEQLRERVAFYLK